MAVVERMLELNKGKHDVAPAFRPAREGARLKPGATSELDRLERDIISTGREIDNLVYELYRITAQEGTIIENA